MGTFVIDAAGMFTGLGNGKTVLILKKSGEHHIRNICISAFVTRGVVDVEHHIWAGANTKQVEILRERLLISRSEAPLTMNHMKMINRWRRYQP